MKNSELDCLWQRPLGSFTDNMTVWYSKVPVSSKTLITFIPDRSRKSELSQIYTNHSFKASGVTMLSKGMYFHLRSRPLLVLNPSSLSRYTWRWMKMRVEDWTEQVQSHVAKYKQTTRSTRSYNNGPPIDCWNAASFTLFHLSVIYRTDIPSQLMLRSILVP